MLFPFPGYLDGTSAQDPREDLVPLPQLLIFFSILFFKNLFRAAPAAYGGSQAKGLIGAAAAGLRHCHSNAGSEPATVTYTAAHGNAGSSTH